MPRFKQFCVHGHEFTPDNTFVYSARGRPSRGCRACARARSRVRRGQEPDNGRLRAREPQRFCKRGHEFTSDNTYVGRSGDGHTYQGCKTCRTIRKRLHRGQSPDDGRPRGPKQHCKNGHEFTPDNTAVLSTGRRRCKTCANERNRLWQAHKRETDPGWASLRGWHGRKEYFQEYYKRNQAYLNERSKRWCRRRDEALDAPRRKRAYSESEKALILFSGASVVELASQLGRSPTAIQRARTYLPNYQKKVRVKKSHCKWGHEYSPENTRMHHGNRECKECHRLRANLRYHAKKVP